MAKLLLMSCVIAIIAVPIACADDKSPRRGLRRTVLLIVAYDLFYVFAMRFIYPHLL